MKKYYYNDGKEQHGPFTLEELKQQGIKRDTHVWFEGMSDWLPAKEVPEIAGVLPPPIVATPPPIKPVTPQQETQPPKDYSNKPIVIRTEKDRAENRIKVGWWIVGGLAAFVVVFLWVTGFFYTGPPYDPCVDSAITNDHFLETVKLGVDYREVPIGGVRDVVVTVTNNEAFDVDDASIIVSYLRQDGSSDSYEVINTGIVQGFATKTFSANGASRGVKAVVYFSSASVSERCFTYTQPDS
jgi:hypothetical protein